MGSSYLLSPLLLIISTLFELYALIVLLRFLLQAVRADFYNPVSQFIVKATTPVLRPLRRIIPGLMGQDIAALVLATLVQWLKLLLLQTLGVELISIASAQAPLGVSILGLLIFALAEVLALLLNIFLFAIIIMVIVSWVNPGSYNPAMGLVNSLVEPVMKPFRKLIPPLGGLDITPIFATLGIMIAKMLLIPPLVYLGTL